MDRSVRIFADARSRWTVLGLVGVIGAMLLVVLTVFDRQADVFTDPVAVRGFVDGFGVLAPLAFVLMQAAQVVIAPIPGQMLGLASGWLFGPYWGTVYSLAGALIGSYIALRLSRHYGRPFVERAIDTAVLDRFDEFSTRHGYFTLFVVFLIPGLPDDVICFVAGTTDLDVRKMTVVSVLGRVPGYFLTNLIGASVATQEYLQAGVIAAVLLALSLVVYFRREQLLAWLFPES